MSITAFMFHDIRNNENIRFKKRYDLKPFLAINQFKKQLEFIISNYKIINTSEIFHIKDDNKYAILTFDDGLVDHYNIQPILKDYKVRGTFFIPVGIIENVVVMKTNKIQFILSAVEEKKLVNEILNHVNDSDKKSTWQMYSKSKFKNNWWSSEMVFITNYLRDYEDYEKTNYIVDRLFSKYVSSNEKVFAENFYLNKGQIIKMINNGMEIGGHGYYSDNLKHISYENQNIDITKTLDYIKNLKQNCDLFISYPNGGFNDDTIKILKLNNCKLAYTTESISVENLDYVDLLKFPRISAPENLIR